MSVATIPAPFLAFDSFRPPAESETSVGYGISERAATRSPFVSVYEAGDDETAYDDPMREAYAGLIDELLRQVRRHADFFLPLLLTDRRRHHLHAEALPVRSADVVGQSDVEVQVLVDHRGLSEEQHTPVRPEQGPSLSRARPSKGCARSAHGLRQAQGERGFFATAGSLRGPLGLRANGEHGVDRLSPNGA